MSILKANLPLLPTTPTTTKAWHDRAIGDLNSWSDGYNPRSQRAAAVWNTHRDELDPWIAAAPSAGITESRRIASAVLELLAWAIPRVNDLDRALTEDSLQQFIRSNPTNLGDGALGNVRARVRRVLKARTALEARGPRTTASRTNPSGNEGDRADASPELAPTGASPKVYSDEAWSLLAAAAEDDSDLATALHNPDGVTPSAWTHAQRVSTRLDITLTKAKVRRTQNVRTLRHPMPGSLASTLRSLGATCLAATEAASLLPATDEETYRAILRGEPASGGSAPSEPPVIDSHCTTASPRHSDEHLAVTNEVVPTLQPAPGGSSIVSPTRQSVSSEPAIPEIGIPPAAHRRRRRKPSARQMRLALAQATAERESRAASLPEAIRTYIRDDYIPLDPVRQQWDHLKGPVEATLAASAVRGDDSMRKHVTHLAYFLHWARTVDLPLDPSTLTRKNVGRYESEVLVDTGRATRQTRRSRLMAMADQIHPDQSPVKGPPLAHRSVAPPYTPPEMAIIRRVAQVQPTNQLVRQMCLLVGLGAGAGIDSTDLKRLRGSDTIDHGPEQGIEVHVTNLRRSKDNTHNANHRTVWVLREYEDLVRTGIHNAKHSHLLLGRDAERANVAATVFTRAVLSKDVPALTQARLRSTWLATHLQRTTPLNTLLQAAGLTTARTLVELLKHLPNEADAQALR